MEYKRTEGGSKGVWEKPEWGAKSSSIIKSINEFLGFVFKCVDKKGE